MSPESHDFFFWFCFVLLPACLSSPKRAGCGCERPLPSSARLKARLKSAATGEGKQKRPDKGVPVAGRRMKAMCGEKGGARGTGLAVEPPRPQLPSAWLHPPPASTPTIRLHWGGRSYCSTELFLWFKVAGADHGRSHTAHGINWIIKSLVP